jgi:hypothetical protein
VLVRAKLGLAAAAPLRRQQLPDLDRDGTADLAIAAEDLCGATGNCSYQIYVSNRGCLRWVGESDGVEVSVLSSEHNGLLDLQNFGKSCLDGGGFTELQFDGTHYELSRSVYCPCPGDPGPRPESLPPECPSD